MPHAPSHPCAEPGCAALLPAGTARCQAHAPKATHGWNPKAPRIRGGTLQRMRARLFSSYPLCVLCLQKQPQVISIATIRDHVVPLAEGGRDDTTNEQALCQYCSDTKTREEARRGRLRRTEEPGGPKMLEKNRP